MGVGPHRSPSDPYRQRNIAASYENAIYGWEDWRIDFLQLCHDPLDCRIAYFLTDYVSFPCYTYENDATAMIQHRASSFGSFYPFTSALFELQRFGFALRS